MFGDTRPVDVELNSTTDSVGSSGSAGMFTVPAEFLFHGDYKRAGADLKIIGQDGKSFVVHDYFKNDKLPTLFAPDGAALSGDVVAALAGPLAPGQYAQATAPQSDAQPIGRVATETGGAVAIRNGVSVALNVGDAVLKGDVIQTQGDSKIGIIFGDGTTFDLGANARMVLGSGYVGTLSAAASADGTVAWAFDATNTDINHLVGQTQNYTINDLNGNQPPTLFSVSVGGAGNDQFVFGANSGTHEMVNFTVTTDNQGHYVGDTIELLNISQSEYNSALAGLASDVHGNAVVHFDTGESITFQHINASIVQAQAGNIFHVGGGNAA